MKNKIIKFIKDFRCNSGIHCYVKGVAWAMNMRCDECTNCRSHSDTYGWRQTRRWVEDVKGSKLYFFKRNMQWEKRKVIFEKYDDSPSDVIFTSIGRYYNADEVHNEFEDIHG